ncbi:hypothetical protein ADUPG1_012148, partial [Aduncisulcus paluster]
MNSTAIAIVDRHGSYVCDFEDKSEAQSAYKYMMTFNKSFVSSPPPSPPSAELKSTVSVDKSVPGVETAIESQPTHSQEPQMTITSATTDTETPLDIIPSGGTEITPSGAEIPQIDTEKERNDDQIHEEHVEVVDPAEQKRLAKIAQAEEKKRKKEEEKRKKEEEKRKKEEAKRHAAENKRRKARGLPTLSEEEEEEEGKAQYAEQEQYNNTTGVDTGLSKISDVRADDFSGPMYVDYQDESSQEHEPAYTALTAAALKRINSGEIKALSLDDRRGDPDSIPPPLPPSASSHGGMSQISHRLGSLRTHGTSHESRISTGA